MENGYEENIVFQTECAVAVYTTERGCVALRQETFYGDDDQVVVIPVNHLRAVIAAMKKEAGIK
jgi:hypothetical protein